MNSIVPILLSLSDIERIAVPHEEVLSIVEDTYRMAGRGQVEVPTKIGVHPDYPKSFLHAMPAWVSGARALGMKWVSYFPGNMQRGVPDSTGVIILNHADHGLPIAIMEGMWVTYARTAACAAVMAKYFAKPNPTRLGLIGCGGLGTWSLLMLAEMFPSLTEVHVASRTEASRTDFAKRMAEKGPWRITPVAGLRHAVEGMDIVDSSLPRPPQPLIKGEWWAKGALAIPLDVVATWDQASLSAADQLVTDDYPGLKGYARRVAPALQIPPEHVDFAKVVIGEVPGRQNAEQRIMAIPTGIASLDITLAATIYERAQRLGIGKPWVMA